MDTAEGAETKAKVGRYFFVGPGGYSGSGRGQA